MTAGRSLRENPYVGPRPFEPTEQLYGRDRELAELYYALSAQRVVLLHSPSGAGKSSLVQAGLIPRLRQRFDVWRPTRVNQEPPEAATEANRYTLSALQGFEEGIPTDLRRPVSELTGQTLADYVTARPRRPDAPDSLVVIFDQFEEVLTVDPLAVEAREQFFDQLGELLRNPGMWALFVLREDYLAPLDPYARRVPTHLKNRFRIDRLDLEEARQAMVEPALAAGRQFPGAQQLVLDLATVKVQQPDGTFSEETGHHVEPVQLQVVCRRLWDAMPADDLSIDAEDLEEHGDVDQALAGYYADSVGRIAAGDPRRERRLRDWCGERLITAGGIRSQVLKGSDTSGGLDNASIEGLRDAHLVRAEQRAGATWFELAHDRLVEPVIQDNVAWLRANLSDVEQRATLWLARSRAPAMLLAGAELTAAEEWAEAQEELNELETEYLEASREAKTAAELERELRQARRVRRLAVLSTVVSLVAVVASVVAFWQFRVAAEQRDLALEKRTVAEKQREYAERASYEADRQRQLALDAQRDLTVALSTAEEAQRAAVESAQEARRQQQEAEAARRAAESAEQEAETQRLIAEVKRLEGDAATLWLVASKERDPEIAGGLRQEAIERGVQAAAIAATVPTACEPTTSFGVYERKVAPVAPDTLDDDQTFYFYLEYISGISIGEYSPFVLTAMFGPAEGLFTRFRDLPAAEFRQVAATRGSNARWPLLFMREGSTASFQHQEVSYTLILDRLGSNDDGDRFALFDVCVDRL